MTNSAEDRDTGHRRLMWIVRTIIVAWVAACAVVALRPATESISATVPMPTPEDANATADTTVVFRCAAVLRSVAVPEQVGGPWEATPRRQPCNRRTSQQVMFYVDVVVGAAALAVTSRTARGWVLRTRRSRAATLSPAA